MLMPAAAMDLDELADRAKGNMDAATLQNWSDPITCGRFLRCSVMMGLVAFTLVGCANPKREAVLEVWRSPNSTLAERATAASELVPRGASPQTAISILGSNGGWTHLYGPNVEIFWGQPDKLPRQLPEYDVWCLEYEFPGGGVHLYFDPPTAVGERFVRAAAFTSNTRANPRAVQSRAQSWRDGPRNQK